MKIIIIILICLINFFAIRGESGHQSNKRDGPVLLHFDPRISTGKLLHTIPASVRQKGDQYTAGGHWLILWNFVNAALIIWIFLFQGLSSYIKSISGSIVSQDLSNSVYLALYFIADYLLSLPLNIYQHFTREKQYGFLNQNFIQWMSRDLLRFMIELAILVPLFLLGYTYLRKIKRNVMMQVVAIFIASVSGVMFFNPVFSKAALTRARTLYSPGFLIKINLEYIMLMLLGFIFVSWALNEFILRYGKRVKLANIRDISSVPLLVLLVTCYLFIITPISNTIKRNAESEADIYELKITRKPDVFALSVIKSADHDKMDPGYWEEAFFFDHPSIKQRIFGAMKWKTENLIFLPFFSIKGFSC